MNIRQIIRDQIKDGDKGLEFGPSFNPIAPKNSGFNTVVVDHLSKEDLLLKYKNEPVDLSKIEDVDIVWEGQDIRTQLPLGEFDYIIASHVIEHVPCFITFINLCTDLLSSNGNLFLIVPDKRFCFDVFRSNTSLGQILDAYHEGRSKPSPSQVLDQLLYSAKNYGAPNWDINTPLSLSVDHTPQYAYDEYNKALTSPEYMDVHCWVFTPSQFRLLVSDLNTLGICNLVESQFYDTSGCEFFVVLSKSSVSNSVISKVKLLDKVISESGCYSNNNNFFRKIFAIFITKTRSCINNYPTLKKYIKKALKIAGSN